MHKLQKEGTVTSYCEAVEYLLGTYAMDDVLTETDAGMMGFTQPSSKSPTEYAEALWNKMPRCDKVYDKYEFKGTFYRGNIGIHTTK